MQRQHESSRVQRQHESFPRLYGAPSRFRGAVPVGGTERPASTDDLPLEHERSWDDRQQADTLGPRPYRHGMRPVAQAPEEDTGELRPSNVSLRGLADRLLRERARRPIVQFTKSTDRGRRPAM